MMGRTHINIGLATVSTGMTLGLITPQIQPLVGVIIGSLLPDIDHENSSLNRTFGIGKIAYFILAIAVIYFSEPYEYRKYLYAVILCLIAFSKHRGITHSILGVIIIAALSYGINNSIYISLLIGYIMHLLSDFFTKRGIELFYPYKKNYKCIFTISTQKVGENVIFVIAILLNIMNLLKIFDIIK